MHNNLTQLELIEVEILDEKKIIFNSNFVCFHCFLSTWQLFELATETWKEMISEQSH